MLKQLALPLFLILAVTDSTGQSLLLVKNQGRSRTTALENGHRITCYLRQPVRDSSIAVYTHELSGRYLRYENGKILMEIYDESTDIDRTNGKSYYRSAHYKANHDTLVWIDTSAVYSLMYSGKQRRALQKIELGLISLMMGSLAVAVAGPNEEWLPVLGNISLIAAMIALPCWFVLDPKTFLIHPRNPKRCKKLWHFSVSN